MKSTLPKTACLILTVLMHADIRGQESSAPPEMKALEGLLGTWSRESPIGNTIHESAL